MKCPPAAFLALGALLASGAAWGDDLAETQGSLVRSESLRLIKADLQQAAIAAASQPNLVASAAPADPSVIQLSPFIVKGKEIPEIPFPRYETPIHRFLRDGTLYQKGNMAIQAGFVRPVRAIGSTGKPSPRFEISISWLF